MDVYQNWHCHNDTIITWRHVIDAHKTSSETLCINSPDICKAYGRINCQFFDRHEEMNDVLDKHGIRYLESDYIILKEWVKCAGQKRPRMELVYKCRRNGPDFETTFYDMWDNNTYRWVSEDIKKGKYRPTTKDKFDDCKTMVLIK